MKFSVRSSRYFRGPVRFSFGMSVCVLCCSYVCRSHCKDLLVSVQLDVLIRGLDMCFILYSCMSSRGVLRMLCVSLNGMSLGRPFWSPTGALAAPHKGASQRRHRRQFCKKPPPLPLCFHLRLCLRPWNLERDQSKSSASSTASISARRDGEEKYDGLRKLEAAEDPFLA